MTERKAKLVDGACWDVAETFLGEVKGSTRKDMWALAENIQQACEDACAEVERRVAGRNDQEILFRRGKPVCACGHRWSQHSRATNGAYACRHHGCGCRDVVPPSGAGR
jgi:hypothetical protein